MCRSVVQRFKCVVDYLRENDHVYNESQLAAKMGIGRSFLSDMKSGRKEITEQTVLKLCELFPFLSFDYIFAGVGEMVVEVSVPDNETPITPGTSVSVPAEAWEIMRMQASSLGRKDAHIGSLINLLEKQISENKENTESATARFDRVIDLLERQMSTSKKSTAKGDAGAPAEVG